MTGDQGECADAGQVLRPVVPALQKTHGAVQRSGEAALQNPKGKLIERVLLLS